MGGPLSWDFKTSDGRVSKVYQPKGAAKFALSAVELGFGGAASFGGVGAAPGCLLDLKIGSLVSYGNLLLLLVLGLVLVLLCCYFYYCCCY